MCIHIFCGFHGIAHLKNGKFEGYIQIDTHPMPQH